MHKSNTTTVRFNLSTGVNFRKWKITYPCGEVVYLDRGTSITMKGCFLRNQPATALKIHEGSYKSVCAWIECDEVLIGEGALQGEEIFYNPKVVPYWHAKKDVNKSIDSSVYSTIIALNAKLYTV